MSLDLTESIAPKSDQLDAIDLVGGARTFTITKVEKNSSPDQPFNFHLAEFPRVWRPGKSMRRVLVKAWGADASQYAGKRVTLYCDPTVQFGPDTVGGTRISHMSDIDGPIKLPLLIKRGKSAVFTVQPLKAEPANEAWKERDWESAIHDERDNRDFLKKLYQEATTTGAPQEILDKIVAAGKAIS